MIKYTTWVWPGAGAETSVFRVQLRLRLHNTAYLEAMHLHIQPNSTFKIFENSGTGLFKWYSWEVKKIGIDTAGWRGR